MTRNEWITQRFSTWMESGKGSIQAWEEALDLIESMANRLEARKVAPWQTPAAPPLTDAAAKVVEAAVVWLLLDSNGDYDWNDSRKARIDLKNAVRAYKESVK